MYWEHQLVNCAFVLCLYDVMFVFSIVKQVCIEFHYVFRELQFFCSLTGFS